MKILTGKVISTKMDKTATVAVERIVAHPIYKKRYKRTKKYQVHAENPVEIGQKVSFVATKPISKTKKWTILEEKKDKKPKTKKVSKKTKKKGSKK